MELHPPLGSWRAWFKTPDADHFRSGLLELCLDLNQNASIPPEVRFDVSLPDPPPRVSSGDSFVPPNITPEEANATVLDYNLMVRQGKIPPLDLVDMRSQVDAKLAAQGIEPLSTLERKVNQPVGTKLDADVEQELGFIPFDQEMEYLARMDAKLSLNGSFPSDPRHREVEQERHHAEFTPRELERKTEFENPQSQHNWLKTHTKVLGNDADGDDTESLASHDLGGGGKPSNKRKSGKGNLAKQVGDRAVERAREGSMAFSNDEDELASDVGLAGSTSGRKRAPKDPDGTYRVKGGKAGAPGAKGKRKRSGEDMPGGPAVAGKKARVDGGGTPLSASAGGGSGIMGLG